MESSSLYHFARISRYSNDVLVVKAAIMPSITADRATRPGIETVPPKKGIRRLFGS
jgi:hypothetical protein